VCITKETTLKGIRVLYLQINKCISADQRFDTFWTHHVYWLGVRWASCGPKHRGSAWSIVPTQQKGRLLFFQEV
jgi:hypothetical protein